MMTIPAKRGHAAALKSDGVNPLSLKPLGNLLFDPELSLVRSQGLGSLARLPDELLLTLVSTLDAVDLVRFGACSKAAYAWSSIEGVWKALYVTETGGKFKSWRGSWRKSFLGLKMDLSARRHCQELDIEVGMCSDVLYQPILCAQFDPKSIKYVETIRTIDAGDDLTPDSLPDYPVILSKEATGSWAARKWTLDNLRSRFPRVEWRAEATLTTLDEYAAYERDCHQDESPLYLFDSNFVEKTKGEMGREYQVLPCFGDDLFSLLEEQRPDYRWLIMGPERSGSTWHRDPNHTSAWNAVMTGSKLWLCFPPSITPPGVFVSDDEAQVECPLSLAEWFMSYWDQTVATFGPRAKDPKLKNVMRVGICKEGETFCVPSRWWHLVVNLEPSIAITQNYVGRRELGAVLDFMRDKPDQVSGFRKARNESDATDDCDEIVEGVYERFKERVLEQRPDLAQIVRDHEKVASQSEEAFSFGFLVEGDDDDAELE